jgi:hypothetical protein
MTYLLLEAGPVIGTYTISLLKKNNSLQLNGLKRRVSNMRKLLLLVILLVAAVWLASSKFDLKSGTSLDGKYNLVLVDKKNGQVHRIVGSN